MIILEAEWKFQGKCRGFSSPPGGDPVPSPSTLTLPAIRSIEKKKLFSQLRPLSLSLACRDCAIERVRAFCIPYKRGLRGAVGAKMSKRKTRTKRRTQRP